MKNIYLSHRFNLLSSPLWQCTARHYIYSSTLQSLFFATPTTQNLTLTKTLPLPIPISKLLKNPNPNLIDSIAIWVKQDAETNERTNKRLKLINFVEFERTMSAAVCGSKRSLFEELPPSPPLSKRLRCSSSTSPIRFPLPSLVDHLRPLFPHMDHLVFLFYFFFVLISTEIENVICFMFYVDSIVRSLVYFDLRFMCFQELFLFLSSKQRMRVRLKIIKC